MVTSDKQFNLSEILQKKIFVFIQQTGNILNQARNFFSELLHKLCLPAESNLLIQLKALYVHKNFIFSYWEFFNRRVEKTIS